FPSHFRQINSYKIQDYLILDEDAKRNLEVFGTYFEGKKKGSLFGLLDETITGMGGRRLRQWLLYPLKNKEKIEERLKLVEFFYSDPLLRSELRELLEGIYDLERLGARVSFGKANPRDLIALKNSVAQIPLIKEKILSVKEEEIKNMAFKMDSLEDIHSMIDNAIIENPPISLHEGGIIKDGYNEELDELRAISKQGKQWIANYEKEQKQLTKINSLKVKYNQVIGYYIEVTKSNLSNIPKDYIRKQSLSNSERFITTKLKEYEDKVLGAQEKINNLEYEIFVDLRKRLAKEVARIMDTSHILSMIDAITSLAEVAHKYNYCKPKIVTSDELLIEQGRHPVVERLNRNERFVPNDTLMDLDNNQLLIITGPNMAGKSTYIRQVALIVLMAHMGSFVPADKAVIPLVDRIFTRVGASDNLVMGQSTFMVEMKETARILKYATPKSLVILDEIGRGTSTFDGLSIAWAVAEYLIDSPLRRCKTLFATHYHELTQLAELKRGVKNYNVAVREWNDKIIFLRKIVEGGSSRSYGIQVARLAGLPEEVIKRAREILKDLESGELQGFSINKNKKDFSQLSLFESLESNLVKEINSIDISTLTPLEALNKLYELQNKLKNNN
ncbi:MAG: DNA mismatch repair protein MutS, partial [Deltaproteobacteria bacterium]|nr:DNA mismatch repair protein MutS [Deltaproteobacteria bacterium]